MENKKGSSDGEDIPSDFFDEFGTDEFIEGLSVVDSWDDTDKKRPGRTRINAEDVNRVDDLRDLIARDKGAEGKIAYKDRFRWRRIPQQPRAKTSAERRSSSASRMDDYIKPGSRRDPSKTNEAIKRDKEEKVKEHLAKRLEANDEILPPGTELDDFFEATKEAKKQSSETKVSVVSPPKERMQKRRESPTKHRIQGFPSRRQHWSPHHQAQSPRKSPRRSPRRFSPRRSPRRYSPRRFSPSRNRKNLRASPRRSSPDLHRRRKSRSPIKHSYRRSRSPNFRDRAVRRRSRTRSRSRGRRVGDDDFLYPKNYFPPDFSQSPATQFSVTHAPQFPGPTAPQYAEPMIMEYPGGVPPGFTYPQPAPYSGYPAPYEYGGPPAAPMVMPAPQPVPAPVLPSAGPVPIDMAPGMVPSMAPGMVPAPQPIPPPMATDPVTTSRRSESAQPPPADALAKLVAEGILSHEDYLKLAPNKGVSTAMDTQSRVAVLNRCNVALSRITTNILNKIPIQMGINNNMLTAGDPEQKLTPPKFCSPLKRQPTIDFYFTNIDASTASKRNKQIIETLIEKLHLEDAIGKPKKKTPKGMKDAETQTTKPFCDMCEIRESTTSNETGTSIDREHIFTSVHTQVVEHDLISSKAVFNPSGSVSDGAPISIAHMTPAQLVSQLAARAKTLKQTEPEPRSSNQFRNPNSYDGRGGNQYQHNNTQLLPARRSFYDEFPSHNYYRDPRRNFIRRMRAAVV